ncbi:MAG TPA: DNA-directed RNA polymerase subunit alpha C-terminal domain-containing protein, partial [Phycisphaerales bacterium]|nr:DNA-directed RNA polymerase subunit alpha C-terminal domain-containing protein [Phycisphaerales bacterium]
ASEQYRRDVDQEIGLIPVDAIYSPVTRVRYRVEDTRVGQRTNYDKLLLEVWTNGTIAPDMALVEAAKVLRKHLSSFVEFFETSRERVSAQPPAANASDELGRKLNMPIGELDLSVRASNCLESAQIKTVGELVSKTEEDLLQILSFDGDSLREVKIRLRLMKLSLGMSSRNQSDLEPKPQDISINYEDTEHGGVAVASSTKLANYTTTRLGDFHIYSNSESVSDYEELENAVEQLVSAFGGTISNRGDVQRGSWWRSMFGRVFSDHNEEATQKQARQLVKYAAALIVSGKQAVDLKFVDKPRTEITAEQAASVVSILNALAHRSQGAIIRLESILFIKQPDIRGGNIFVQQLSSAASRQLAADPTILTNIQRAEEFIRTFDLVNGPVTNNEEDVGADIRADDESKKQIATNTSTKQ